MKRSQLRKIKDLYERGENLMQYFRGKDSYSANDPESIMISYDFQAGTYIDYARDNPSYIYNYTKALADIFNSIEFKSLLEVGVGEATTLCNVVKKLHKKDIEVYGFDLSWSRVKYAKKYCKENGVETKLFVADLFNVPLRDNAIDIVYTFHSVEPNGGREKEALEELYIITANYLILLEPCYELASPEARKRMEKLGYITSLQEEIQNLGYRVVEFRLFDYCSNPLNPTSLTIIKKRCSSAAIEPQSLFVCPITNSEMKEYQDCCFCKDSLLAYPKILGIPCLLPENAIVASHFEKFIAEKF